jgi:CheY-like chemotaxis protein
MEAFLTEIVVTAKSGMTTANMPPIILCSGFSADISSRRADASGVRAILKKPILKREMAESIRRVLD